MAFYSHVKGCSTMIIFACLLLLQLPCTLSEKLVNGTCPSSSQTKCRDGVFLPKWNPVDGLSVGDRAARATVYFVCLMYLFLGVSIIADRFMAAIEVITSQEKEVTFKTKSGEVQTIYVRIWNETVSNLTLMALGSSAPEILLSIIEICGNNFEAGDLGPGTIVGSAAFNLFVIIGICIIVIPNGEVRRIKHLSVFFITSSMSIFAYLWLYLIIALITPGVVDVWEAVTTFMFFPVIVVCAYIADTKIFFKKFLQKKFSPTRMHKSTRKSLELGNHMEEVTFEPDPNAANLTEYEHTRLSYVNTIKELRKRHPDMSTQKLEELAQLEVLSKGPKSRAFYRMQATRQLTGSGNVLKKSKLEKHLSLEEAQKQSEQYPAHIQRIFFNPGHYTVFEDIGTVSVTVTRVGGDMSAVVGVDYATQDGTAIAGEDYVAISGRLIFDKDEVDKKIDITIIDDDIFEEDEHFNVLLTGCQVMQSKAPMTVVLVDPTLATVMVLDDDHSGVFNFEHPTIKVTESCEYAEIKVVRLTGCRGVVNVPYTTIEGSAKGAGADFEDNSGILEFQNNQTEAFIHVRIMDDNDYEKMEHFFVELGQPTLIAKDANSVRKFAEKWQNRLRLGQTQGALQRFLQRRGTTVSTTIPVLPEESTFPSETGQVRVEEPMETGNPRLGDTFKVRVNITESVEFRSTVDRLVKQGKWNLYIGTSSWKEQFVEAITVSAGGADEEDEEEKLPSCMDYVMHFLTLFWKVLFAFVPPTDYCGGWLCFTICICVIGALTAIIGDVASSFGCTVGLTDAVTATTFVALGTSVPDTFASKVAAIGDQYADSSIGNVTGSNAVNVFLGIGVAWSIAAIYHATKGGQFIVQTGSLGFSVTIFCIFAVVALALIVLRRRPSIGGELGGPKVIKYLSGGFFFFLWIVYIVLAGLENYCHIEGF